MCWSVRPERWHSHVPARTSAHPPPLRLAFIGGSMVEHLSGKRLPSSASRERIGSSSATIPHSITRLASRLASRLAGKAPATYLAVCDRSKLEGAEGGPLPCQMPSPVIRLSSTLTALTRATRDLNHRPCFMLAAMTRAFPSAVRGPVELASVQPTPVSIPNGGLLARSTPTCFCKAALARPIGPVTGFPTRFDERFVINMTA